MIGTCVVQYFEPWVGRQLLYTVLARPAELSARPDELLGWQAELSARPDELLGWQAEPSVQYLERFLFMR
jgi:hypothetical protein